MTLIWGWDATHNDLSGVPAGQGAGYTTGTPDIQWTPADWQAHPGAARICQDARATDATADTLDVEQFAATPAEAPDWTSRAYASYAAGTRPGQRYPAVYCSLSAVPDVSLALRPPYAGPIPKLWVAHWGITMDDAAALIGTVIDGLTVVGVQFADRGAYDADVWDAAWLETVSAGPVPPVTPPGGPTLSERLATMPELAQGATGPAVGTLQSLLRNRGFHLGTSGPDGNGVDRDFGPLTHAAVIAFQQEQKIADDGIVGPVTWPLLPLS